MSNPRVIIEISPSRVEVALLRARGGLAEWRCERADQSDWPTPYTTVLPDVAACVKRLLAELNAQGADATVVYDTPGCVTAHSTCAAGVALGVGEQAARLSLAGVADFPLDEAPADACLLFSEAPRKGAADAPAAQRHFVAAADAPERAEALCAALAEAGVRPDRLVPAGAVAIADAARAASAQREGGRVTAIVWVGEHATTLAVGEPGRLILVRAVATGAETLAEALKRPLRPAQPDAEPVSLDHSQARALLYTTGVPAPGDAVPGHPTLAGSSLLPHLQPLLQRFSTEIKQSLRFGVPEAERARVELRFAGPGAAVPGLAEAVSRLSGFALAPADPNDQPDALDSSTGGLIAALVRCPKLDLDLAPSDVRAAHAVKRLRKAVLAGAGLAALLIGLEAADAYSALARERGRLAAMTAQDAAEAPALALRQKVVDARVALAGVEGRMARAFGEAADWPGVLGLLAEATPPEVRVQSIDMAQDSGRPRVSMHAHVRLASTPDPAGLIRGYVRTLERAPVIDSARFGAAQRVTLAGHDAQAFDLTLGVVPLPPTFATAPAPSPSTAAAPTGAP